MKRLFYLLFFSTCAFLYAEEDFETLMGAKTKHWNYVSQKGDVAFLSHAKAVYEKQRAAQFTQQGPYKIPPTVHFIWLGPKHFPPESVDNVRMWIAKNPGWKVKFWTDRKREAPCRGMEIAYVADFAFHFLEKCYRDSENWGEKSDILRYEILFQEGGVYVDHDANCLQSFEGMHKGYDFYCGLEAPHEPFVNRNITCGNGIVGARASHPTIKKVMELIQERWHPLKMKFRGNDPYSKIEIVMQRTYIALTDALESSFDALGAIGDSDIILPSAYFFAKSGIPSLYSKHFYATSWDDFRERRSDSERVNEKNAHKLMYESKRLSHYLLILIAFNLFFAAVVFKLILREKK